MNNVKYIEFMRTSTPGPYGIPLTVINHNENEIMFEIEIDNTIHGFSIPKTEIVSSIVSPGQNDLYFVEITPSTMSSLYEKITAVVRSEENTFIL